MSDFEPTVPEGTWEELDRLEGEHWARRKRELGPGEGLRVAAELYSYIRKVRQDWPSPVERAADLALHVRVGEELRRVCRGT